MQSTVSNHTARSDMVWMAIFQKGASTRTGLYPANHVRDHPPAFRAVNKSAIRKPKIFSRRTPQKIRSPFGFFGAFAGVPRDLPSRP